MAIPMTDADRKAKSVGLIRMALDDLDTVKSHVHNSNIDTPTAFWQFMTLAEDALRGAWRELEDAEVRVG